MASLTVRDIPDDVLRRLRRAAAEQRRSVNAQAIEWLAQASRRAWTAGDWEEVLADLRRGRALIPRRRTDSTRLIRRMRDTR